MAKIDLLFLIVFAYAGYAGFRKGLISQVVGVAALLLGIWACLHLTDYVASVINISTYTADGATSRLLLFTITFAGTVLLVYMAGKLAGRIIKAAMLEWLNKLAGLLFGIAKRALIVSVALTLLGHSGFADRMISVEVRQQSLFYAPVQGFAPWLFPRLNSFNLDFVDRVMGDDPQPEDVEV